MTVDIKTKPDPYDDWYIVQRNVGEFFVGCRYPLTGPVMHLKPYYGQRTHVIASGQSLANVNSFEAGICESLPLTPGDATLPLLSHPNARAIIAQIEGAENAKRASGAGLVLASGRA